MAINRGTWLSCATAVCLSAGLNAGAQAATGETLYSFKGYQHGSIPLAGVYLDPNGNLFGTLSDDGFSSRHDNGVAYELTQKGGKWVQKRLHRFYPGLGDGANPTGALIPDGTGALYGTTAKGGSYGRKSGGGIVFKLTPPSNGVGEWTESILYSFNGRSEGTQTGGGLIFDSKGSLYLTHDLAGTGLSGTVSMLSPPAQGATAWTDSTIYTFQGGTDGGEPSGAPLVFDASGALYGVTQYGGGGTVCGTGYGCGTVYKLTPPAQGNGPWTETILYTFTGGADGSEPNSNLVFDKNGNLYSTTYYGGAYSNGTVFELSPPTGGQTTWTETVVHSLNGNVGDGFYPQGNTIMTSSGNLLVATTGGGTDDAGTIIQLQPPAGNGSWSEEVLYSLPGENGAQPIGITLDTNGNIYGTTIYGGNRGGNGVAFEVNP